MAEFIGIEISNVEQIYLALAELPPQLLDAGADAVLDYWRGVLRNPANYAPYKRVRRATAYPNAAYAPGWFSRAQLRFVMARIRSGEITPGIPQRTGRLAASWDKVGSGEAAFLANRAPYASFVIGDGQQANQPRLVGWLTAGQVINQQRVVAGAVRALQVAVDKAIKRGMAKAG
jgi:hypothetical protein